MFRRQREPDRIVERFEHLLCVIVFHMAYVSTSRRVCPYRDQMMDGTDRSQRRQDKFVGRVRMKGYELLRVSLRELFYEQTSRKQ